MELIVRDIPRIYTALAEWTACLVPIILMRNRIKGLKLYLVSAAFLVIQILFMVFTADLAGDFLWILCMLVAFAIMLAYIRICCDAPIMDCIFCCARDFILAEFMASLEWQIHCFIWPEKGTYALQLQVPLLVVVYFLICFLFIRLEKNHTPPDGNLNVTGRELYSVLLITIVVFTISNLSFVSVNTPFSAFNDSEIMNIRTIVDLGGIAVLYAYFVQCSEYRIRHELEAVQTIVRNQYQQYQQSRESIDTLNRKYHDFKHQIIALRTETDEEKRNAFLEEIENDIKDYEAQNKTGHQVLDTLLTSKSLYCARKKIGLTSVVDGKQLAFMNTMDLCSIFGNALDNAIECEEGISDPSKRLIHLTVSAQKGFVLIRVENYIEGDLQFKDGLPVTKKEDKSLHGFGMKSMRVVAQKYNGTMTTSVKNSWFELKILLPVPKQTEEKENGLV